ncbi:MAG: endopeptidase La [Bradymonadales bacterium]|jgi:ATP-dependent Lon protease
MSDNIADILEGTEIFDDSKLPEKLFIFPLGHMVVFPDVVMPIVVPPGALLDLVKRAQSHSDYLGFLWSKSDEPENTKPEDLAKVGCIGRIMRMARMPDGSYTMLVYCVRRLRVQSFLKSDRLIAEVEYLSDIFEDSDTLQALWRNVQRIMSELINLNTALPKDVISSMLTIDNPGKLADMVSAHFQIEVAERQRILEILDVKERLEAVYTVLVREMDLVELGQKIHEQIKERIEESQKEFFLREQLSAIRRELGEEKDEKGLNIEEYAAKIEQSGMSEEATQRAVEQLERLSVLPPDAAEYNVIRTYLDWLCDLPWSTQTEDNLDLNHAEKVLNQDHFALEDIKERIVEFLAVKKLKPDHQGQIICFLGPPGVGKTSLARSINRALGRKFYGFSLGGLRDEAEIKGHRRTYIGAMPGKILQGLKRVGVRNPVFVLDEIDKLGNDWRGDPSSAMLEVLDPSQNNSFNDHYLDVAFDLSAVMFIATANDASTIPRPLLDRMEVIELAGYIDEEKYQIARRHIVPKQIEQHGLTKKQIQFTPNALRRIIRDYTREAGVRDLERQIAKICRKNATKLAKGQDLEIKLRPDNVSDYLGAAIYVDEVMSRKMLPGLSVGLAWTQFGGEILFIESTSMPGQGQLKLSGQLGEVMSESVQIAFSYIRANMKLFGLKEDMFQKTDFHVHFPAGAIPKDGPSAGITVVTSILSLLRNQAIPPRMAMTGEITLVGNVLAVGGIKEKIIAAKRSGARVIAMSIKNKRDVDELADYIKDGIRFIFVETYKELFGFVFRGEEKGLIIVPSEGEQEKKESETAKKENKESETAKKKVKEKAKKDTLVEKKSSLKKPKKPTKSTKNTNAEDGKSNE